ncbi:phosphomannomutase [Abditibacterium utsteinense]|uniref:Phosphomannomutase n=1 Tax=Abditibacterium utsteinense TaxID=1960156 RepID=A0A2S8SQB8_9BACT|nr:phosphomannomutase/phosphoglucomutase [Abditibacterium utsteinense]PQV63001.1 phosphomannomutase [Abditibacterium utsteinense]
MAGIFKAYDIRGVVGEALSPQIAYLIGRGLASQIFAGEGPIALTRDMRTHSPQLFGELSRGLRDGGCDTVEVGLAATPMNYWAINHYNARGGVQVTASHNGPEYNGFKVSGPKATPLDYSTGLDRVEAFVLEAQKNGAPATEKIGSQTVVENALDEYLKWMQGFCDFGARKLKIAIDTGNGMGGNFLPGFLQTHPQFEISKLFWELDGNFPNHEADPLKPENIVDLQKLVREQPFDFGVAFDGDADRCMFVDENGDAISSDLVTALIAGEMLEKTPGSAILYDLRSSQAVPQYVSEHGGRPVRGRVGHSFMKRLLVKENARFGGELSGHYYFADCFNTDSGLMAFIQILDLLSKSDQPLSAHIAPLRRYSASGEVNFRVEDAKTTLEKVENHFASEGAKMDHLDGLTVEVGDIKSGGWWFNLRSSNTEPLLRLNLEAQNEGERDKYFAQVQELLGAEPATGH